MKSVSSQRFLGLRNHAAACGFLPQAISPHINLLFAIPMASQFLDGELAPQPRVRASSLSPLTTLPLGLPWKRARVPYPYGSHADENLAQARTSVRHSSVDSPSG